MRDSTVHGPYSDFRLMYAKRVVADDQIRRAGSRISLLTSRTASLEQELGVANEKAAGYQRQAKDANDNAYALQQQLITCAGKRDALRGWATLGKVTVYGSLALGALFGANELFSFIP